VLAVGFVMHALVSDIQRVLSLVGVAHLRYPFFAAIDMHAAGRRLVASLSRLLDPAEALAAAEPGELSVTASRPAGGIHVPGPAVAPPRAG
jgi:hypothetical protein